MKNQNHVTLGRELCHWTLSLALFLPHILFQKDDIWLYDGKSIPFVDSSLTYVPVFWIVMSPFRCSTDLECSQLNFISPWNLFIEFSLSVNGPITASVTETQESLLAFPCPLPSTSSQPSSCVTLPWTLYSLLFRVSVCFLLDHRNSLQTDSVVSRLSEGTVIFLKCNVIM